MRKHICLCLFFPYYAGCTAVRDYFHKRAAVDYLLNSQRYGYLVVAKDSVEIENVILREGDGGAISEIDILSIKAIGASEMVLVVTGKKPIILRKNNNGGI